MVANNVIEIENRNYLSPVMDTPENEIKAQLKKAEARKKLIKSLLVENIDYGTIPGCGDKPTLFKAGAEKIIVTFALRTEYDIIDQQTVYEGIGFFAYTVRSKIYAGNIKLHEGLGHANSKEVKFAYRWVSKSKVPIHLNLNTLPTRRVRSQYDDGFYNEYRIEEDMNSKANTLLKMAKKRAQVDAVLTVAGLSDTFTQDFDDSDDLETDTIEPTNEIPDESVIEEPVTPRQKTKCSGCGKNLNEQQHEFSMKHYKQPLCFNCQRKSTIDSGKPTHNNNNNNNNKLR